MRCRARAGGGLSGGLSVQDRAAQTIVAPTLPQPVQSSLTLWNLEKN